MIILFCVLLFFSLLLCFDFNNRKKSYFISFTLLLVFSLFSRARSFENDFLVYSSFLSLNYDVFSDFYYSREFLYWWGSKTIYNILGDVSYTFSVIDVLFFGIFSFFCYYRKLPAYFLISFFLIFPSILGFFNVYRQFLATILIVVAIFSNVGFIKKTFLFIFSFFIHNVSFLFYSFIFLNSKKYFLAFLSFIFSLGLTVIAYGGKSDSETGSFNPIVYVFFIFLLFLAYLALSKFKIYKYKIFEFYGYLYSILLLLFSIALMGTGQSKRIGMIVFMISFVQFVLHYEDKIEDKQIKMIVRFVVVIFAGLSSLILPATFEMLK